MITTPELVAKVVAAETPADLRALWAEHMTQLVATDFCYRAFMAKATLLGMPADPRGDAMSDSMPPNLIYVSRDAHMDFHGVSEADQLLIRVRQLADAWLHDEHHQDWGGAVVRSCGRMLSDTLKNGG